MASRASLLRLLAVVRLGEARQYVQGSFLAIIEPDKITPGAVASFLASSHPPPTPIQPVECEYLDDLSALYQHHVAATLETNGRSLSCPHPPKLCRPFAAAALDAGGSSPVVVVTIRPPCSPFPARLAWPSRASTGTPGRHRILLRHLTTCRPALKCRLAKAPSSSASWSPTMTLIATTTRASPQSDQRALSRLCEAS